MNHARGAQDTPQNLSSKGMGIPYLVCPHEFNFHPHALASKQQYQNNKGNKNRETDFMQLVKQLWPEFHG